jgi:hypothetical protein
LVVWNEQVLKIFQIQVRVEVDQIIHCPQPKESTAACSCRWLRELVRWACCGRAKDPTTWAWCCTAPREKIRWIGWTLSWGHHLPLLSRLCLPTTWESDQIACCELGQRNPIPSGGWSAWIQLRTFGCSQETTNWGSWDCQWSQEDHQETGCQWGRVRLIWRVYQHLQGWSDHWIDSRLVRDSQGLWGWRSREEWRIWILFGHWRRSVESRPWGC